MVPRLEPIRKENDAGVPLAVWGLEVIRGTSGEHALPSIFLSLTIHLNVLKSTPVNTAAVERLTSGFT